MSSFTPLPPNATKPERALAEAAGHAGDVSVIVKEVWNPETCPAPLLPWLASARSVDVWNPEWTTDQKRAAIKASLNVHRKKGTIGAVVDALAALGFNAQVQEWFNQVPPAAPYTYRLIIEVDQIGFDLEDVALLLEVVRNAKNLRSHLTEIKPIIQTIAGPIVASSHMLGSEITIPSNIYQEAGLLPDFLAAEDILNTITNEYLAQSLGV